MTLDEARFRNRATAGQDRLDVAARALHSCGGPTGSGALSPPAKDVDGLKRLLGSFEARYESDLTQLRQQNNSLRSLLADTSERLGRVERLLAERWGTA